MVSAKTIQIRNIKSHSMSYAVDEGRPFVWHPEATSFIVYQL